jgi:hypothetical protein
LRDNRVPFPIVVQLIVVQFLDPTTAPKSRQ